MRLTRVSLILISLSGFFFACNPVKLVPDGRSLLVKNVVKADTSILASESFEKYLKQKPNRRILGLFRFHLGVYNWGSSGENSKFKTWLRKIGEEPVLLDSELTVRSKHQLELFLNKNGFFNANVTDSTKVKKKKATVYYNIKYRQPYTYRDLYYTSQDTGIGPLMNYFKNNSLLIKGNRYSEDEIEKERDRIVTDLKDRGYYFFNRNFITFQIDSSLGTHETDVYLYLNRINENVNSSSVPDPVMDHQKYKLRKIIIQTDFDPKDPTNSIRRDTSIYNGYYIISGDKRCIIKDNFLVRNLFIKSGDMYLQRDLDMTYKRLQEINLFKFINLYFKEVPRDENQPDYLLDLEIQLTPMDKLDFTIESEVTNTGSNIGLAGSFGYRDKNTFCAAEVLELKIKAGVEYIPNSTTTTESSNFLVFNTYEIGPEVNFTLKKLLMPGKIERKVSKYADPKTNFNLGYNHQNSPDYVRSITNFGFSWAWNLTTKQRLTIYPIDINSVLVTLSPEFAAQLDDLNDPSLKYAYETHLITAARISWSTNNQKPGFNKNFVYFRSTLEYAYKAFETNITPSQYTKIYFDFTHNHNVNRYSNFISHLTMGIGIPRKQSLSLPFEKSFFAGGANSMRAWYAQTLGPGAYKKTVDIAQGGDIKFETNFEYRSEFIEFANGMKLEAAAFVDIGNIWTLNDDVSRPGGKFSSQAIRELGIGSGLGLRFNFSFFIFRLDAAVKLRDPALDENVRWVYPNQKFVIGDIIPSLGIGYPF